MPTGGGRPDVKLAGLVAAGIVVVAILWSSYLQVSPGELAVILRFGRFERTEEAGPHLKIPWPLENAFIRRVDEIRRVNIGYTTDRRGNVVHVRRQSQMLTGDKNIVDCPVSIQYRIGDLPAFLFHLESPQEVLQDVGEATIREIIGRHPIDDAISERKDMIEIEILDKMQEVMNRDYDAGLEILAIQLRDVRPPDPVVDAFLDVTSAKEDSARMLEEADRFRNRIVPRATGEYQRKVQAARADSISRVRQAIGQADRFIDVWREYRRAKEVTETRLYLETMEKVLAGRPKFIVGTEGTINLLPLARDLVGGGR